MAPGWRRLPLDRGSGIEPEPLAEFPGVMAATHAASDPPQPLPAWWHPGGLISALLHAAGCPWLGLIQWGGPWEGQLRRRRRYLAWLGIWREKTLLPAPTKTPRAGLGPQP